MDYNHYGNLKSLDNPFDPNVKMSGFVEYSAYSDKKPYQKAEYGFGIKPPVFVGIPTRKNVYEKLCVLPKDKDQKDIKNDDGSKSVFPEFDRGMLVYRHPR
jgi:hypothetical protein